MRKKKGVITTVGAINWAQEVRELCKSVNGDCRECQLGHQEKLEDTLCPRLTNPKDWTDEKIADMVRASKIGGKK